MANIGNSPGVASQRVVTTFTATAGQTLFVPNGGYTLGYCDVFLNGIKLVNGDDYTAANGINFTLTSGAAVGDAVECVAYFPRGLSDGYTKAETDARHVLKSGDTITGTLNVVGTTWNNATGGDFLVKNSSVVGAAITAVPTSSAFPAGWSWYSGSTNAAIGDGAFGAWNHTTQDWAMRFDQAGRAKFNKQPVCVIGCQNADINWNMGDVINFGGNGSYASTKIVDNYSSYNFSTGRYTAPATGNYFISATANGRNYNGGVPRARIRKNGASVGGDIHLRGNSGISGNNGIGDLDQRAISIVLPLSAGDYIDFYVHENGFDTFSANYFCAYMLG